MCALNICVEIRMVGETFFSMCEGPGGKCLVMGSEDKKFPGLMFGIPQLNLAWIFQDPCRPGLASNWALDKVNITKEQHHTTKTNSPVMSCPATDSAGPGDLCLAFIQQGTHQWAFHAVAPVLDRIVPKSSCRRLVYWSQTYLSQS